MLSGKDQLGMASTAKTLEAGGIHAVFAVYHPGHTGLQLLLSLGQRGQDSGAGVDGYGRILTDRDRITAATKQGKPRNQIANHGNRLQGRARTDTRPDAIENAANDGERMSARSNGSQERDTDRRIERGQTDLGLSSRERRGENDALPGIRPVQTRGGDEDEH